MTAAVFMTIEIIAASLQQSPDRVHPNIDEIQAEKLLSNKVHQTKGNDDVNIMYFLWGGRCEYLF